ARVAERLAALGVREDRAQRLVGTLAKRVRMLNGEPTEDRDELLRRVVGEVDLTREARPQTRVRLEEPAHEPRIPGHDHDEAVPVILHPLEQRLDRLVAEVESRG